MIGVSQKKKKNTPLNFGLCLYGVVNQKFVLIILDLGGWWWLKLAYEKKKKEKKKKKKRDWKSQIIRQYLT